MNASELETMIANYAECALWSSTDGDDDDRPMDTTRTPADFAPETLEQFRSDCEAFYAANAADLSDVTAEQAGHDFWLTRNGHGAGFWDRGLGEIGDRLTDAARAYGEVTLFVQDDGRIYG